MQVQLDAEPEPSAAPLFPFSRRSSRSRIPASFLLSGEWATVVTTALRCCVRRTSSLRLVVERRLPHRSTPSSTPVPKPSVVEHVIDRLLPSVRSLCRPSLSIEPKQVWFQNRRGQSSPSPVHTGDESHHALFQCSVSCQPPAEPLR
jgi:hypothetical protein